MKHPGTLIEREKTLICFKASQILSVLRHVVSQPCAAVILHLNEAEAQTFWNHFLLLLQRIQIDFSPLINICIPAKKQRTVK